MNGFTLKQSHTAWSDVYEEVSEYEPDTHIRYSKTSLPHPREAGAHVSIGIPVGQTADYRFPPDAQCRGLHVQDFGEEWFVHLDRVHPSCDIAEHVRRDAPKTWVAGGTGIGAAIGLALSGKKEGLVIGAALGLVTAVLTAAIAQDQKQKEEQSRE